MKHAGNLQILPADEKEHQPQLPKSNLILLRSLQNHTEHGLGQNLNTSNELMMAEINFLEAKKYLADAHAR